MNFFPSKKEVIELDEQMRTYEQEMKHLTGDALEQKNESVYKCYS